MKKSILLLLLPLLVCLGCSTMEGIPSAENTYSQTIDFPGIKKDKSESAPR